MSVSLYYTAERDQPLNQKEKEIVTSLIEKASIEEELEEYLKTGKGADWEPFFVYNEIDSDPMIIFEGATKLPSNTSENMMRGFNHWKSLLSRIRIAIPDASWHVHLDDTDILWDEATKTYS